MGPVELVRVATIGLVMAGALSVPWLAALLVHQVRTYVLSALTDTTPRKFQSTLRKCTAISVHLVVSLARIRRLVGAIFVRQDTFGPALSMVAFAAIILLSRDL